MGSSLPLCVARFPCVWLASLVCGSLPLCVARFPCVWLASLVCGSLPLCVARFSCVWLASLVGGSLFLWGACFPCVWLASHVEGSLPMWRARFPCVWLASLVRGSLSLCEACLLNYFLLPPPPPSIFYYSCVVTNNCNIRGENVLITLRIFWYWYLNHEIALLDLYTRVCGVFVQELMSKKEKLQASIRQETQLIDNYKVLSLSLSILPSIILSPPNATLNMLNMHHYSAHLYPCFPSSLQSSHPLILHVILPMVTPTHAHPYPCSLVLSNSLTLLSSMSSYPWSPLPMLPSSLQFSHPLILHVILPMLTPTHAP